VTFVDQHHDSVPFKIDNVWFGGMLGSEVTSTPGKLVSITFFSHLSIEM
jgi:hypothetical protein